MASFLNINDNLTAMKARQVGAGASFLEATYLLAGQPPRPVSMGLQEVVNEEGEKMWVRSRLGSLLDHEDIADLVMEHEKAALLAKKNGGAIVTAIRNNQAKDLEKRERTNVERAAQGLPPKDAEGGYPYEWDHWAFTLSPDETAWLKANPDREDDFRAIVSLGMIRHPMADGVRQALITPIHKDTGDWHIQGLVSRFALDVSGPKPVVPPAVEVSTSSHMSKLVAMMQAEFDRAGMPISINKTDLGLASKRGLFESRATTDAAKEAYIVAVQDAGGVPGARTTVGPIPGPQASATAIATLVPEVTALERGKSLATDDGLKMASRMQQLTAEMEATRTAMEAAAAREATFDAAIAALGQKAAAEAAQATAEAQAAQEAHLRELAEQEAARAAEKAAEADRLATEAREHAATLVAELKAAGETIAGEPRRIEEAEALAVAPVAAELIDVRADLVRSQQHAEQMEARADALEAELAEERRSLPEKIAAAVSAAVAEARADWDRTILQPLRDERDAFKRDVEAVKAELKAARDTIAAVPGQIEAAVKAAVAEAVKATTDKIESTVVQPMREAVTAATTQAAEWMKQAQDTFARLTGLSERMDAQQATHAAELASREAALTAERAGREADQVRMEARLAALEARLSGRQQPPAPPADEPDAPAPDAPPKPPRGGGDQGGGGQGGGSAPRAAPAAPPSPAAPATPPPSDTPISKAVESGAPDEGNDYSRVPLNQKLSTAQERFMSKKLDEMKDAGKCVGWDLGKFRTKAHEAWVKKNPAAPAPDGLPEERKPR